jgi:transcriptional regulator with XRE-family HTH domain
MGAGRVPVWNLQDRLRKAREDAGFDQVALADLLGVSRRTVSNAERASVQVRRITINAWALATGVDLAWLLTGECAIRDSNPKPADVVLLRPGGDAA